MLLVFFKEQIWQIIMGNEKQGWAFQVLDDRKY